MGFGFARNLPLPLQTLHQVRVFHRSPEWMLNLTPGLVPLLKKALWSTHSQGTTRRAALCYEGSVHISQEIWDKGWGCGYVLLPSLFNYKHV